MANPNPFNAPLIQVLKEAIFRCRERIERAEQDITRYKVELLKLGVDPDVIDSL